MREKTLSLLGLMRKARALEPGEANTGAAVRGGRAKLLLLASDASDNARKRAETFAFGRRVITLPLPFDKEELAGCLGTGECAMAAVTDLGFAAALTALLEQLDPETYGPAAEEIRRRRDRAERRKKETAARKSGKSMGKMRTNG